MFDRTRAVGNKIIDDMKKTSFVISIIAQTFLIAYYIYSLIFQNGIWQIKAVLLALATAYFIFYIIISQKGKSGKKIKKLVKMIYRYMKYVMSIVTIGMSIFTLCSDWSNSLLWDAVFVAINCLTLLIQIIVEVIRKVGEGYITLLQEAIQEDAKPFIKIYETVTNPVAAAVDFINKPMSALARKLSPDKAKPKEIPQENAKLIRIMEAYKVDEDEKELQAKLDKKAEIKEAKDMLRESAYLVKEAIKNKLKFGKHNIEENQTVNEDNKGKNKNVEILKDNSENKLNNKIHGNYSNNENNVANNKSDSITEHKKDRSNKVNTTADKNTVLNTEDLSQNEKTVTNDNKPKFGFRKKPEKPEQNCEIEIDEQIIENKDKSKSGFAKKQEKSEENCDSEISEQIIANDNKPKFGFIKRREKAQEKDENKKNKQSEKINGEFVENNVEQYEKVNNQNEANLRKSETINIDSAEIDSEESVLQPEKKENVLKRFFGKKV